MKTFCEIIRELREDRDLKQADVAVVHCASGTDGVAISHRTGFETAARPMWYGDE